MLQKTRLPSKTGLLTFVVDCMCQFRRLPFASLNPLARNGRRLGIRVGSYGAITTVMASVSGVFVMPSEAANVTKITAVEQTALAK